MQMKFLKHHLKNLDTFLVIVLCNQIAGSDNFGYLPFITFAVL